MKKYLVTYAASVAGFSAAMALLVLDEKEPQIRRGKLRAVPLSLVWPLYASAAAVTLCRGSSACRRP